MDCIRKKIFDYLVNNCVFLRIIGGCKMRHEMVAMILAGGQGTRLGKLTRETAKPAVPFGGKYRIIDFTLSNCSNSSIFEVGVVTQYQPLELNEHIGNGSSWGLARRNSSAKILQPYSSQDGEKWFRGTANAIYQNISYIDSKNPEYVLVLSGDHIYKMDYEAMLEEHKKNEAALTVAVIEVPLEEASRFGIMETDSSDRIIEFHEKPKEPKGTLASMGIYIFDWKKLRHYLVHDQATERRMEDFGKHVIPSYIDNGERVFAYAFDGYWKDVGTIESLWEANMEFLDLDHQLNIRDSKWPIYTKVTISPPQYIAENATIKHSMVGDGCYINGDVKHSVLSGDVKVGKDSSISQSIIMAGATIGKNVQIEYAIIGEKAVIADGASVIGTRDEIQVIGYHEIVGGLTNEAE